jgi:hypothetical protein
MLTESRDAKRPRKQEQILATASLSSPHFDANPFLAVSDKVRGFSGFPATFVCRSDGAARAVMEICRVFESGFMREGALEMRTSRWS